MTHCVILVEFIYSPTLIDLLSPHLALAHRKINHELKNLDLDPFSKAKGKLQLSSLPDSLPGREHEHTEIITTVRNCILNRTGACLCIIHVICTLTTSYNRGAWYWKDRYRVSSDENTCRRIGSE